MCVPRALAVTVPLVQSTLLYAHMLPRAHALGGAVAEDDATPGYGVAFAATMLPLLRDCDKASGGTTADVSQSLSTCSVGQLVKQGGSKSSFCGAVEG